MGVYLINCINIEASRLSEEIECYYSIGDTEGEAVKNANIPLNCEINDVFYMCQVDELDDEEDKNLLMALKK